MYDSLDDESPLLGGGGGGGGGGPGKGGKSSPPAPSRRNEMMINRVLTLVLLGGLVAVSCYLQAGQAQLHQLLASDEEKIHGLQVTIDLQERIIERFNESVTNGDVLKRLDKMEGQWAAERDDLTEQLKTTRAQVEDELSSTMAALGDTVAKAEEEIQAQVDTVKKNFDQYVLHTEDQFSMENTFMVFQLAGTFTLLSCLISMWHMGSHMRRMSQPAIQRKILAILWMCPIYAVTSWLSLVFPESAGYLAIIKDAYEAYIIYQFLSFCISVLGKGNRSKVIDLLANQVDHLTPPFRLFPCCCKPHYEDNRALADAILTQCQAFTMQFVFWRPVTTIANFLLNKYQYFGPWADGPHDWKAPQFWVTLIQNLSIFTAFAGLLKFYHAVDKDLEWCRPFAKFLCIKGVVFMTFWQGLAITVLAETTDMGGAKSDQWAESAQNFLICLEMLLFSIAHFYCFPVEEWREGYQANYNKAKFGETLALNDFFTDLKLVMAAGSGSSHRKRKAKLPSEPTVPEGDEETVDETVDEEGKGSSREWDTSRGSSVDCSDDNNGGSDDEDDPNRALVHALVKSVRELDEEEPDGEAQAARLRMSNMLADMLFVPSPRHSGHSPPSPPLGIDNANAGDDGCDDDGNHEDTKEVERMFDGTKEGEVEDDPDEIEEAAETTGLLTGASASVLAGNLKPSIFTTIGDHMEYGEKNNGGAQDEANRDGGKRD